MLRARRTSGWTISFLDHANGRRHEGLIELDSYQFRELRAVDLDRGCRLVVLALILLYKA